METSLKTGFAQSFSRCPKNLSCPKFGGAAAPLAPPARTPMVPPRETSPAIVISEPFFARTYVRPDFVAIRRRKFAAL